MKQTASLLLRLVGLTTLLLATVTKASNDLGLPLTPQEAAVCGALPATVPAFASLPGRVAAAPLRVVAIGSSSTAGAGASQPARGYVSQLADRLKTAWPAGAEVLNRGVGGNVLADIVKRAPDDLFALNPGVVVLQTGTNDALRNVPVAAYRKQLQAFVTALGQRQIAVVLVDNQYLPNQLGSAEFAGIQRATYDVARLNHLPLVSRFALSEALQAKLHLTPEALLAADGLHPNDTMHACTAEALSATLLKAFGTATEAVAGTGKTTATN